jgi:diguanylate cyclase (GGDEF)-like protein
MIAWYALIVGLLLVGLLSSLVLPNVVSAPGQIGYLIVYCLVGSVTVGWMGTRTPGWVLHLLIDLNVVVICLIFVLRESEVLATVPLIILVVASIYAATWFDRGAVVLHLIFLTVVSAVVVFGRDGDPGMRAVWVVVIALCWGLGIFANTLVRHLKMQIMIDPLTGLANRTALLEEISRALAAGQRSDRLTAVLMLGLDRFQGVNDTFGHGVGDALLGSAVDRIEKVSRAGDLVARLGGDVFVVAMRELDDPEEALGAAARLVEEFREPFLFNGLEMYATASVGVAIAARGGDAGHVLRDADAAMCTAKEAGRDRVSVFNEDLRTVLALRLAVETELRRARERGQLALWYQPEVNLLTGKVIAVEALLRWNHPDGTVWCPDKFIPVAEDTGLVLTIGDWVLREACNQAAAWARSRSIPRITTRVNVSALQLAESRLLDTVDNALATSGLDPSLLCLEITEGTLLRETGIVRINLNGIHDRGISLAIDDFGTGFASLTYLSRYPIDVIKIDRSFIAGTTDLDRDHRLVAGIIGLSKTLGITVTAEGVETPEQAALLLEMGCPSAQGWLYSKALPADEVTPLLDRTYPTGTVLIDPSLDQA